MNRPAFLRPRILVAFASLFLMTAVVFGADNDKDPSDIEKRINNSAKVVDEIMAPPEKGIPDKIMSDAKCIAIIPSMVKIAVGFGGSHGKGVGGAFDLKTGRAIRKTLSLTLPAHRSYPTAIA